MTPGLSFNKALRLAQLGPSYLSVHLRRTDHWGGPASDAEFVAFVATSATSERKVFLATDNAETQQKVRHIHPFPPS